MRNPVQRLFFCSSTHRLYAGIAGRLQSFDTRTGCQLEQFEWEAPPSQPPPAGISKKKKNKSIGIGKVDMDADVGGRSIASLGSESGSGASMVVGEGGSIAEMVAVEEEGKGGRGGRGLTGSPAAKKRRVEEEEGGGSSTGTTTTTVTTTSATAAAAATTTTTNSTTTTTAPAENTPAPTPGPDTPQQQKGKRGRKSKIGPRAGAGWAEAHRGINSITSIAATRSGRYLVLASNEDKSVRVFDTGKGENGEGRIVMLSERGMPKRPCSVKLIEKDDDKNTVIICADKFGDVYSLPLFTSPKAPQPTAEAAKKKDEKRPNNNNPNSKNLGPLTKQEKMAMISRDSLANLEQKELPFENTLLLGHVSLLIDVVPVTVNVDGKERTFILSADKDEHIRISRFPQAYVIEGFCLGHKMFVTKLLVPSWNKRMLFSGGGDDYLLRWDWLKRKALEKIELREHVTAILDGLSQKKKKDGAPTSTSTEAMDVDVDTADVKMGSTEEENDGKQEETTNEEEEFHLSVTGMWELKLQGRHLLVACERFPALFVYSEMKNGDGESIRYQHTKTIHFSGNVLDAAVDEESKRLWVSVDTRKVFEAVQSTENPLVEVVDIEKLDIITSQDEATRKINQDISWEMGEGAREKLDEFLYPAKHFKKFEGEGEGFEDRDRVSTAVAE